MPIFTNRQLKEKMQSIEASHKSEMDEMKALLEASETEASANDSALNELASVSTALETAKAELETAKATIETLKADHSKELETLKASKDEEVKELAKEKAIDTLAEAGADLNLADGANAESQIQSFEARLEAAQKAGGMESAQFFRDNKAEIKEFIQSK